MKTGTPGPLEERGGGGGGEKDPLKEKWLILRLHSAGRLSEAMVQPKQPKFYVCPCTYQFT